MRLYTGDVIRYENKVLMLCFLDGAATFIVLSEANRGHKWDLSIEVSPQKIKSGLEEEDIRYILNKWTAKPLGELDWEVLYGRGTRY